MNKKRLLKLADLLEADAKNSEGVKFDLRDWGRVKDKSEVLSCGTYACAAGLAAISGAFKRQGLSYRLKPNPFSETFEVQITLNGRCRGTADHVGSFVSVRKFFDLSTKDTEFLFTPDKYPGLKTTEAEGEKIVANRIRDFVAGEAVAPAE